MILNENLLSLYAETGLNVLLSGRHGVGKTEIIKKIFEKHFDDSWAYFSAATMDAWVDFIGVPKPVKRKDGSVVLDLIQPARFHDDQVEALFFDEFNRAPEKVRNAVMELIQFRSINGRKFKNLKVIWAAINPDDIEDLDYDVEKIDPAQLDRFEIQIDMPYKLDKKYFKTKYPEDYLPFVEWWEALDKELKYKVSPRRLETAIKVYKIGGLLSHCLKKETNITDLNKRIKNVSLNKEWEIVQNKNEEEKSVFFNNISNVAKFENFIKKEFKEYVKYIPADFLIMKFKKERSVSWLKLSVKYNESIPIEIKQEVSRETGKGFLETLSLWGKFKIVKKENV